jgi:hypothetical protein
MTLHVARWDQFGYAGKNYDRGQIIELIGAPNDEKLLRLGYISELKEKSPRILECGECGAKFLEDSARVAHGRRHHPARERIPEMVPAVTSPLGDDPRVFVDTDGDREERRRMESTPLYLDKTQASIRG